MDFTRVESHTNTQISEVPNGRVIPSTCWVQCVLFLTNYVVLSQPRASWRDTPGVLLRPCSGFATDLSVKPPTATLDAEHLAGLSPRRLGFVLGTLGTVTLPLSYVLVWDLSFVSARHFLFIFYFFASKPRLAWI